MPPDRFDTSRPFITLGLMVAIWFLVPTAVKRISQIGFYELQAPVEVSASYLRELQDYWAWRSRSKTEIYKAYQDLGRVSAQYAHAADENATLRREVEKLETLLRLPTFAAYRSEPARVVSRDLNAWWQRLIIRKGANHGIVKGAPVIFAGGVVGRIAEVHENTATVDLITSSAVRLAASFEGDDRPISYQGGQNPPLSRPQGIVEFVPLDLFATPADPKALVTSGLGGVFPRGLRIGLVTVLEPSPDGLFKTGRIQLDPRLNELTEVTVLIPLDPL
ncbi:MAG: rod shape-determining protein MreC [Synoicihabitans sp.]